MTPQDDVDDDTQQPLESLLTKRRLQQFSPSSAYSKKQNASYQSTYLNSLRGWLGAMFLISFANSIQSFVDIKFLSKSIYTSSPGSVNPLMARLFGMWTLVSALLRICCAIDFNNRMLYHITVFSFLLSTGHFLGELLLFQTAGPGIGIIMSLLFSGLSAMAMIIGYWFLQPQVKELKKSL